MAKAICSIEGCDRHVAGRGWCHMHWQRWRKHGDPLTRSAPKPPRQRCSVADCDSVAHARGWCIGHYQRWYKLGDPEAVTLHSMTIPERFEVKVDKASPGGCWLWTGANNGRYPVFQKGGRYAHRWSYEHHVGPIPEGYEVDHLCRVTLCVNPAHLEAVTPQENKRRARVA